MHGGFGSWRGTVCIITCPVLSDEVTNTKTTEPHTFPGLPQALHELSRDFMKSWPYQGTNDGTHVQSIRPI